jgi:hypothetical protein
MNEVLHHDLPAVASRREREVAAVARPWIGL